MSSYVCIFVQKEKKNQQKMVKLTRKKGKAKCANEVTTSRQPSPLIINVGKMIN